MWRERGGIQATHWFAGLLLDERFFFSLLAGLGLVPGARGHILRHICTKPSRSRLGALRYPITGNHQGCPMLRWIT